MGGRTLAPGASPRPSSAGMGPVEAEQLLKELFGMYDPVKEDLSEYLERITRLVLALKTLGHRVSAVDLERITMNGLMQPLKVGTWRKISTQPCLGGRCVCGRY